MSKLHFPGSSEIDLSYESGPSSHNPQLPYSASQAELLLEALFTRRGIESSNIELVQGAILKGEKYTSYESLKEAVLTGSFAQAIDSMQQINSLISDIAISLSVTLKLAYEHYEKQEQTALQMHTNQSGQ